MVFADSRATRIFTCASWRNTLKLRTGGMLRSSSLWLLCLSSSSAHGQPVSPAWAYVICIVLPLIWTVPVGIIQAITNDSARPQSFHWVHRRVHAARPPSCYDDVQKLRLSLHVSGAVLRTGSQIGTWVTPGSPEIPLSFSLLMNGSLSIPI